MATINDSISRRRFLQVAPAVVLAPALPVAEPGPLDEYINRLKDFQAKLLKANPEEVMTLYAEGVQAADQLVEYLTSIEFDNSVIRPRL